MGAVRQPTDVLMRSLDDLNEAIGANIERSELMRRKIAALRAQLELGVPAKDAVFAEPNPVIVELITENINSLHELGARLRWSLASLLRAEGMSAAEIARLFGVSRQRVSALLNTPPAAIDG